MPPSLSCFWSTTRRSPPGSTPLARALLRRLPRRRLRGGAGRARVPRRLGGPTAESCGVRWPSYPAARARASQRGADPVGRLARSIAFGAFAFPCSASRGKVEGAPDSVGPYAFATRYAANTRSAWPPLTRTALTPGPLSPTSSVEMPRAATSEYLLARRTKSTRRSSRLTLARERAHELLDHEGVEDLWSNLRDERSASGAGRGPALTARRSGPLGRPASERKHFRSGGQPSSSRRSSTGKQVGRVRGERRAAVVAALAQRRRVYVEPLANLLERCDGYRDAGGQVGRKGAPGCAPITACVALPGGRKGSGCGRSPLFGPGR